MQYIPSNEIATGPDRQRQKIDPQAVQDLAANIEEVGLLHPIVVVKTSTGYDLVAGERRLRAMRLLHETKGIFRYGTHVVSPDEIPCTVAEWSPELTWAQQEAELSENLQRLDLTWRERVAALAKLSELRKKQNPAQTSKDTAKELAAKPGETKTVSTLRRTISQAEQIAPHLDSSILAHATNVDQAERILIRQHEHELQAKLNELTPSGKHKLKNGDLHELFTKFKPGTFKCIIADPPYGIEAGKFGNVGKLTHTYQDTPDAAFEIVECIAREGLRTAADFCKLWLFCAFENFPRLADICTEAGWLVWNKPLIWYRPGPSAHAPLGAKGFRRNYELILAASHGDQPYTSIAPDVIQVPTVVKKSHPAEKPVELYEELIKRSVVAGTTVLDPCCGSGPIFPAANRQKVNAVGFEIDKAFYKIAQSRLKASD